MTTLKFIAPNCFQDNSTLQQQIVTTYTYHYVIKTTNALLQCRIVLGALGAMNFSVVMINFFKQNSYPANFIYDASPYNLHRKQQIDTSSRDGEQKEEIGELVVIPYMTGMSEDIRRACRKFDTRVAINFSTQGQGYVITSL